MLRRIVLAGLLACIATVPSPSPARAHDDVCVHDWGLHTAFDLSFAGVGSFTPGVNFSLYPNTGLPVCLTYTGITGFSGEITGYVGSAWGTGTASSGSHTLAVELIWVGSQMEIVGTLTRVDAPGEVVAALHSSLHWNYPHFTYNDFYFIGATEIAHAPAS